MSEASSKEDANEFRVERQGRKLYMSSFYVLEKSITLRKAMKFHFLSRSVTKAGWFTGSDVT
jgi:hypothetical protein